jgi:hypothetical protein
MDTDERVQTGSRCVGARGHVLRGNGVLLRELVTPYE